MEYVLVGKLERVAHAHGISADFVITSGMNKGKTVDMFYSPKDAHQAGMLNQNFERNWPKNIIGIQDHLKKADFVPMDISFFDKKYQNIIINHINSLPKSQQSRIIIFQ